MKRNGKAFIDVNVLNVDEAASKQLDEEVGATGGADAESGAAEAVEREPALADEGAGVSPDHGVEVPEDLENHLVRQTRVDPIVPSHIKNPMIMIMIMVMVMITMMNLRDCFCSYLFFPRGGDNRWSRQLKAFVLLLDLPEMSLTLSLSSNYLYHTMQ